MDNVIVYPRPAGFPWWILWFILSICLIIVIVVLFIILTRRKTNPISQVPDYSVNILTDTSLKVSWNIASPDLLSGDILSVYITSQVPIIAQCQVVNSDVRAVTGIDPKLISGITINNLNAFTCHLIYVAVIKTRNDTNACTFLIGLAFMKAIVPATPFAIGTVDAAGFFIGVDETTVSNVSLGAFPTILVSGLTGDTEVFWNYASGLTGVTGPTLQNGQLYQTILGQTYVLMDDSGTLCVIPLTSVNPIILDKTIWLYVNNQWCLSTNAAPLIASKRCIIPDMPHKANSKLSVISIETQPDQVTVKNTFEGQRWNNITSANDTCS